MYLLDTVILSDLRRKAPSPNVVAWVSSKPSEDLFVSVITLMEIQRGADLKRIKEPDAARQLDRWLDGIVSAFASNTLVVSTDIARRWGELEARLKQSNVDLAIAATAMSHSLQVVTRNVRNFRPTGVAIINPFDLP